MRTTTASLILTALMMFGLTLTAVGRPGEKAARQAGWPVTPVPETVAGLSGARDLPGVGAATASFDDGYYTLPRSGTIKVCAIRVHFQPDTLSTTWGDGSFMDAMPDSIDAEDWILDRPPHDKPYFQDHLLAARNYFTEHSNGALTLRGVLNPDEGGDVFPLERQASYELPYPIWHINYGNDDEQRLNEKLVQLFVDAWTLADEDPDVDVNQYNMFVVFHAGAGNEFDTGYDLTPFDVPSVYISRDDIRSYAGLLDGVELEEGKVYGGLILPSTQRQPGVDVGLHGTVVAQMGYALGLPHLYDTEDGDAGIGMFGLMDRGFGAYFGQIPIPPSPWSRIFLGWDTPVTIDASTSYDSLKLGAPHLPDDVFSDDLSGDDPVVRLLRIPINDDEYYLAEARLRDPDEDSTTVAWDRDGRTITFYDDYSWEAEDGFRVAVEYEDYDFDLPASGVLLWHIDDAVIREKYDDDTVNNDPDRRGVRVIEADGTNDIGEEYAFLQAGDGSEYGWRDDAFFQNNETWEEANRPLFRTEFSTNTAPASMANTGGFTHITMTDFSTVGDTMSFRLSNGWTLPGFPADVNASDDEILDLLIVNLNTADDTAGVNGDGVVSEIVALDVNGDLYAWRANGQPLGPQPLFSHPGGYQRAHLMAAAPLADSDRWNVYLGSRGGLVRVAWDATNDAPDVASWLFDTDYAPDAADLIALHPDMIVDTVWEGYGPVLLIQGRQTGDAPVLITANPDLGWRSEQPLPVTPDAGTLERVDGMLLAGRDPSEPVLRLYAALATGEVVSVSSPAVTGQSFRLQAFMSLEDGETVIDGVLVPDSRSAGDGDLIPYLRTNANRLFSYGLGWHPVARSPDAGAPATTQVEFMAEVDVPMGDLRALDLDRDGYAEPAFLGPNGTVYAVEPNGIISEGAPVDLSRRAGRVMNALNYVFDSDGDGSFEWLVKTRLDLGDTTATMFAAYDLADGRLMPGWPLEVPGSLSGETWAVVGELTESESGFEMVTLTRERPDSGPYTLSAYSLPTRGGTPGAAVWGARDGGPGRGNSFSPLEYAMGAVSPATQRGGEAYIWPNPVLDGDIAHVRVFNGASRAAYIEVTVYDLAGREVLATSDTIQGQGEIELPVNVATLPSGVYVARVKADGDVQTIRFAVVN